jgi:hypothetical protein
VKRTAAALITLGFLVATFWFGRSAPPASGPPVAAPADCIEQMFAAAERGDVEAYLACFTGRERKRLDRELASQPREVFAQALVQSIQELKGRAVLDAPAASAASQEAAITVERVYVHRMERQTYHLVLQSQQWRIDDVQAANPLQPEKAYGQPVYELAPVAEVLESEPSGKE